MIILVLLALLAQALPDPAKTPGVTRPLSVKTICATKWGADRRAVTEAMKRAVAAAYGLRRDQIVAYGKGPCCEYDHLLSRELGGADDVKNLWPQRWAEAKKKDRLENRLHALVCAGQLDLKTAQHVIVTDWAAAFQQYVGP